MSADADNLDLHERALAELLELGLAAARRVQARLLEAEDAREVCDLSLAFGRTSRAVRQTIMLQSKLVETLRDQERAPMDRFPVQPVELICCAMPRRGFSI